jgi:hypothetical protein
MTEQKTTTTIEVLAPARRCVVSGWQPSESLPCSGSADYCSSGFCWVTPRWSRTNSSPWIGLHPLGADDVPDEPVGTGGPVVSIVFDARLQRDRVLASGRGHG